MRSLGKLSPITLAITRHNRLAASGMFAAVCLALCSTPALAGVQTPENTKWIGTSPSQSFIEQFKFTQEQIDNQIDIDGFGKLRFGVTDSNIWGANQTSTSIDYSLSSSQWNSVFGRPPTARLGVGYVGEVCVPLLGCAKAGAAAGIELETYVLPYLKLDFDPGTFDAKVEYAPSVIYQSEGLGVDFSELDTRSNLVSNQSEFRLDAPSLFLETGVNIELNVNLFAEACLVGCFLDETFELYSTDFKVPLVRLDTGSGAAPGSEAEFIVFKPSPDTILNDIADLIANPGAPLIETFKDSLYTDATPLLVGTVESKLNEQLSEENKKRWDDAKAALSSAPVTVDFSLPFSKDDGAVVGFVNGVASKEIGGELLGLSLDVDKVIGYAFGLTDGAKFSLDQFGVDTGPVSASIELGDARVGPVIELKTDVSLTPELMVNLEFDSEVRIRGQIGKQTSYYGAWDDLPEIALSAESNILGVGETVNDKTVSATPTFSVDATVRNHTYLDLKAKASIDLLKIELDIEGDGLAGFEFGPVLEYEAKSGSLYQIDLFNDSFAANNWNALATNSEGVESELSQQGITGKALTFNGFGEIIFQARAEGGANDFFYDNDARIDDNLTTSEVLAAQRSKHQANLYDSSQNGIEHFKTFFPDYVDETLSDAVYNELKIENESAAHVMQDGLFTNNSGKTFTVELGGGLELGKDNNYKVRSLATEGLDEQANTVAGVINNGKLQIFGDVYSNAGVENDGHKFINAAKGNNGTTPSLLVGASGWLKFDGQFINEGFVNNYGAIELTAKDNKTSQFFANHYGGEIDLHGSLSLERKRFESLNNSGTVSVFAGGELEVERTQENPNYVDLNNRGNLVIDAGGELRMMQSAANSAGAGHAAELSNAGTVSNSGYVLNESGQIIRNGAENVDFSSLISSNGDWRNSSAMVLRAANLVNVDTAQKEFLSKNKDMEAVAIANANHRKLWLDSNTGADREVAIKAYGTSTKELADYRKSGGKLSVAANIVQQLVSSMTNDGFGVWENESGSLLVNEGKLENNAVLVNHVGASTYNSGVLDNAGYLLNTGQLINNKGTAQTPAALTNTGRLENGTAQIGLANLSETTNLGRIENRGDLVNHDTLVNFGSINSLDDGTGKTASTRIQNNGSLANLGQLQTAAVMTNAQGAEINNYATIKNTGVIDNHGFLNNGVQGSSAAQSDIAAQGEAASAFYASIQALQKSNQALQNVSQQYKNELARQSTNGFKGMVNADSAEAWATHLYEKYLVSNLAGNEFSDSYGPNQGSLAKDREAIRNWVLDEFDGQRSIDTGCAESLLNCYKAYYGNRQRIGEQAINYNFSNSTNRVNDNTGIQAFAKYNESAYFENQAPDLQEDQNRFEWTLLMMMEAEGLNIGALDCIRDSNCANGEGLNGGEQQTRKSFYLSYGLGFRDTQNGEQDFEPGDINQLEALYARWTDEIFFESEAYSRNGKDLMLTDVSTYNSPATELVKIYKEMYSEGNTYTPSGLIESIQQQLSGLPASEFGALFAAMSDIANVNVDLLLSALGSTLGSANFDLAAITSIDANLDNSGTFNNRGVVNNSAIISNSEGGVINNSGVLMVGTTGSIENDGTINLENYVLTTADPLSGLSSQEQEGLLISNGLINNRGLIDISAGTLVNGTTKKSSPDGPVTLVNAQTIITNDGSIKLSAQSQVKDGNLILGNASLINNATIVNNGLIEIGAENSFKLYDDNGLLLGNVYSSNTLRNQGNLINQAGGEISNNGILYNAGLIENQAGAKFTNAGLLNNTESGTLTFADNATIGGVLINNGLIEMDEGRLLTLTGSISGGGTFAGDTSLIGATVNPGNSPGLLTFNGDVSASDVDWVMEIWGTERGVTYDAIDINGDFNLLGDMSISILSLLDFDTLINQDFSFFDVSGNLFDSFGKIVDSSFEFFGFTDEMEGNWTGNWIKKIQGGWSLNLAYVGDNIDMYADLRAAAGLTGGPTTQVSAPGSLLLMFSGLLFLGWRKRANNKISSK